MTTRALAKSVVVGVVPPNSPIVTWSYSNGSFIHFPGGNKAIARDGGAVDRHGARGELEDGPLAFGQNLFRRRGQRSREQRQRNRRVRLDRHPRGIGRKLAPALRFLEAGARRAAEVRDVGDD